MYTDAELIEEHARLRKEALAGIESVRADYARHSAGARAVAEKMFAARTVLGAMLERIGAR